MKISYSKKYLKLSETQLDYITNKIDRLKNLARRIDDSSSHAEIEIAKENSHPNNISMTINFKVPNKLFRAEALESSPEAAIDACEEKLKVQIEKNKAQFGANDMHSHKQGDIEDDATSEFADLI